MLTKSLIVLCFNGKPRAICDYIVKPGIELTKNNLVIGLLIASKPITAWRSFFSKQPPSLYKYKGIYFIRPVYLLPFQRFGVITALNRWLFFRIIYPGLLSKAEHSYRRQLGTEKYIFFYHPETQPGYSQIIYDFFSKKYISILDMVDFPLRATQQDRAWYKRFIESIDHVFVNSQTLFGLFTGIRKNLVLVPPGFSLDEFSHPVRSNIRLPKDKPVIGFIGGIGSRLDYKLLFGLIQRNPQYYFAFFGPKQYLDPITGSSYRQQIEKLLHFPNVIHGFVQDKKILASVVKQFDIGIIPYDPEAPLNRYCYPMKLFEYFYLGKPVISTPIEELIRFSDFVKIYRTTEEWEKGIRLVLSKSWSSSLALVQRRIAIANSWDKKIKKIFETIDERR